MRKYNNCSPAEGGRVLSFLLALALLLTVSGGIAGTGAFAEDAASEATGEQTEAVAEAGGETKKASLTKVDDSFADDKWELILNQPALFHRMTYTDRAITTSFCRRNTTRRPPTRWCSFCRT